MRLSRWFAHERDGDMHSFDLDGAASGVRVFVSALLRNLARRLGARPRGSA